MEFNLDKEIILECLKSAGMIGCDATSYEDMQGDPMQFARLILLAVKLTK